MENTSYKDVKKCIKKRAKDSHKGENGCVLVIGGCEDYVSAPALSAYSALRTGIDLIVVASTEKAAYAINSFAIDFITKKMKGTYFSPEHTKDLLEFAKTFDAVLIGPGIGKRPETKAFVNEFIEKCDTPLIVDADAIQQVRKKFVKGILCPHEREFEICFGVRPPKELKPRIETVKDYAKKFNCVILLKGVIDIISDGKKVKLNKTGNEGMTVGGTGDILSGLCAGFIAQKANYFDAASAAAFINGTIGDRLKKKMGYGFTASDFLPLIPEIIYKKGK